MEIHSLIQCCYLLNINYIYILYLKIQFASDYSILIKNKSLNIIHYNVLVLIYWNQLFSITHLWLNKHFIAMSKPSEQY